MISFHWQCHFFLFTLAETKLILVTRICLLGTELEVLGTLESQVLLRLTLLALQTKDDLTSCLGLLVEDWLGLTSETHLLGIVTTLSLGEVRSLSCLVLCDLVDLVLTALLAGAISLTFFGYVNHFDCIVTME